MSEEKTITRAEISKALRKKFKMPQTRALETIDIILDEVTKTLKKEKELKIPLFGVFFVREKKERMGRNPQTLESAKITARRVAGLRVSRLLKKRINDSLA